ncbi:hydroxypyruvate isomerase family protein [Synoicihabitans lomoniglobus]|uniref:TIM barrel protein n=1 Tax=Synoicihabitans lomoniglobus TaxID=2909285 RepID=A0AAF0A170_9BACT|nr:TIM barrel protein [Opitutaceae bacterium LMO-M01]WED65518.1 TIM barrel protein [Opitutaceae bacterium LMO-M01]
MNRRHFTQSFLAAGAAAFLTGPSRLLAQSAPRAAPFELGYAPHPGMFKAIAGDDVVDQIKFAADQGFTAWEDNGMAGRPPAQQEAIGRTLANRGMQMGVFVAYANFDEPTFTVPHAEKQAEVLDRVRHAVEVAQRCGARWFTVVPGSVDQQTDKTGSWNRYGGARLAAGYQTAHAIDLLRRCAAILEPHDLTMVLEPLNWHANHGGVWLQRSDQAYAVCKAVNSPSCKILFDIYHQQITEGNLIPNIDHCWDEIAYFQCGDNPGRKEPGTGEINYRNVFRHLKARGFAGVVGMEHGNAQPGADGERAVIAAYRDADRA